MQQPRPREEWCDREEERGRRGGVQVLARAAVILRLLATDSSGGLTFTELAARSGLPRTTVHRICGALRCEGYVTSDAATGRLHLGPGIMRLATSRHDLATVVRPYLEHLACEVNETVDLAVLDGAQVLFIAQVLAPQRVLMVVSRVGGRFPAFCTASGKALLAQLSPEDVRGRLPQQMETPAGRRPIARRALLAELSEVRETGLAYDLEEHHAGICAVGVAVGDSVAGSAAISLPMPVARFREDGECVSGALLRLREEVQVALRGSATAAASPAPQG